MKIVLFDGIQEMHVVNSLRRALEKRGHSVLSTGKLTSGFEFIKSTEDYSAVERSIQRIELTSPDLIVVFRPSALPFHYLRRLRRTGTKIFAWFSDDPVLWNYTYKQATNEYDMILHCGNSEVLGFYEDKFGRPTGVNFPFWTDTQEFPYVYETDETDKEIVFFGNVSDSIRRQRYYDLARLNQPLRIYGKSDPDYFGIGAEYLDFRHETLAMARKAKISINIPQLFSVRKDDPSWFEGLDRLGSFEIPSRVIQCAAMGIPVISVDPFEATPSAFQSAFNVESIEECNTLIERIDSQTILSNASDAGFEEFLRYFTAASRAMALEDLIINDSWRSLGAIERSTWYRSFDALGHRQIDDFRFKHDRDIDSSFTKNRASVTLRTPDFQVARTNHCHVTLVGERWQDSFSNASVFARAISTSNTEVSKFDLFRNGSQYKTEDPSGVFQALIDIEKFIDSSPSPEHAAVFVGSKFYPTFGSAMNNSISVQFHLLEDAAPSQRTDRIVGLSEVVTFRNKKLYDYYVSRGNSNIHYVSDPVESVPQEFLESKRDGIVVLAQRQSHLSLNSSIIEAVKLLNARVVVAEDYYKDPTADRFYADLTSRVTVILPDPSRADNIGSKFVTTAMQISNHVGIPRGTSDIHQFMEPPNLFFFSSIQEMISKLRRALNSENNVRLMTDDHPLYYNFINGLLPFSSVIEPGAVNK